MFSSQHVRPIPLLSSDHSSEDETMAPTRKRLSYTELVNTQPPTWHHITTLITVCCITFTQSLQLYLPLLLTWDLDSSDMTLLIISYPLPSFLAPLMDALLLTQLSLSRRMSGVLVTSLLLLLVSVLAKGSLHTAVVMRCLAGVLVVPHSVLIQLWTHIFPESRHRTCQLLTWCSSVAPLALTLLLLTSYDENDYTVSVVCVVALTLITYLTSTILSFWIIETPLMQLHNGRYSKIMDSIKRVFRGPHIDSLKLQEIDFSEDSATGLWSPVYLYNEQRNNRNVMILGLQTFVRGFVVVVILCGLVFGCNGELCSADDHRIRSDLEYVLMGCSSLLGPHLLPLQLRHQLILASITGILSLALLTARVFVSPGTTLLLCLTLSSHSSLNSAVSHLLSTVSISVAGECLIGLVFTAGLIIGKLTTDSGMMYALIASTVLVGSILVSGWFIQLPPCKDVVSNDNMIIEMDDPIVETIEMEEELVEGASDRESDFQQNQYDTLTRFDITS